MRIWVKRRARQINKSGILVGKSPNATDLDYNGLNVMSDKPMNNPEGSQELPLGQDSYQRVRITKTTISILRKYAYLQKTQGELIENAVVTADRQLAFDNPTMTDLVGTQQALAAVLREANVCVLEVFRAVTEMELLEEHHHLVAPLEEELKKAKRK